MRNLLLIIGIIFCFNQLSAQHKNISLSGKILNEGSEPLEGATVILMHAKDSIIASFGISGVNGEFILKRVKPGDYILQANFVGHVPLENQLSVTDAVEKMELDNIILKNANTVLDEVTVRADRIPMQINKDTIQYNADAFKTQPNDVVEDLLRKLPGIEVEDDGTIKAQGEEVEEILVDGKEFFGGDKQMATKNIAADAVDKVEVFDRKSDMAEFTGIDDGNEQKAINLELKEDYKKGVFGNARLGYGTSDSYDAKANVYKFSKKTQLSLITNSNNINQQGFSIDDYVNFSGGLSSLMSGGGMMRIRSGQTNNGFNINQGLSDGNVRSSGVGLNVNHEFSKKTELNVSYLFNHIKNETIQDVFRESITESGNFTTEENSNTLTKNGNHRVNYRLDQTIDSMQALTLRGSFSLNTSDLTSSSESFSNDTQGALQNTASINNDGDGDNFDIDASLLYKRKLGKKGRTFSGEMEVAKNNQDQYVLLHSENTFYQTNGDPFMELISQDQNQDDNQFDFGVTINYTEPVGKAQYIGLKLEHKNYSSEQVKDIFDIEDEELIFNRALSNHYNRSYTFDRGELSYQWIKGRSNLNIGVAAKNALLDGELVLDQADIKNEFFNILPSLNWKFDLANTKNINFRYRTSTREPSLTQLQPIIDNSNPLSIYIGNPDLDLEYRHNIRLRYFSFSQFSMTNFFVMLNGTYTDNAIINARTIDNQLRQVTSPVNVDNDFSLRSFFGFGTPLKFMASRINMNGNYTYNNGFVVLNGQEEKSRGGISSLNVNVDNQSKDIFDISVGAGITYSKTTYELSDNLDQDFWRQRYTADITVNFAPNWSFESEMTYSIYDASNTPANQRIPLWNAGISAFVLDKKGTIKLSVFDILDQNTGVQQNIELNYIEDVRLNSLAQYFMLSFEYAFNQTGQQGNTFKMPGGMRFRGR